MSYTWHQLVRICQLATPQMQQIQLLQAAQAAQANRQVRWAAVYDQMMQAAQLFEANWPAAHILAVMHLQAPQVTQPADVIRQKCQHLDQLQRQQTYALIKAASK